MTRKIGNAAETEQIILRAEKYQNVDEKEQMLLVSHITVLMGRNEQVTERCRIQKIR